MVKDKVAYVRLRFAQAGYRKNLEVDHLENSEQDRLYRGVRRFKKQLFENWPRNWRREVVIPRSKLIECLVNSGVVEDYRKGEGFLKYLDGRRLYSEADRFITVTQWDNGNKGNYMVFKSRRPHAIRNSSEKKSP